MAIPGADSRPPSGGLAQVKADAIGTAAQLAGPLLAISQGAKVSAVALAMVKGALMTKVLGPLAMVSGAAAGLTSSLKVLVTVFGRLGLEGAKGLEKLEKSFQPLLRSAALARQRVKELAAFSKVTPFKVENIAAANRALELFTKGAYSNIRAMRVVGDVAAQTGTDIADVGEAVGKVYGEIQSGAPLGRAIRQLVSMGAVSAETADRVENLKNAGVSGAAVWKVLEQDLQRSSGAMLEMGQTLEGLQGKYESAKNALITGFGKGFMAGEKKSLEAMIGAMQTLTPVAEHFGGMFGLLHQGFETGSSGVIKFVSKIKILPEILKLVGDGAVALLATIGILSGILISKFVVGIVGATGALGAHAAAQRATAGATALYSGVVEKLTAALKALAAGNLAAAGSEVKQAAGLVMASSAADRKNAGMLALGNIAKKAGGALMMVVRAVFNLAKGLVATPIGLLVTALTVLSVVGYRLFEVWKKNREALEAFKQATRDANAEFERQIGLMKTAADKAELYRKATDRLIEAKRKLAQAEQSGDKKQIRAAREELADAQRNRETVKNVDNSKLALTPEENERQRKAQKALRGAEFTASKSEYDAEMAAQKKTKEQLDKHAADREDLRNAMDDSGKAIAANHQKQGNLQSAVKFFGGNKTKRGREAMRELEKTRAEGAELERQQSERQAQYDTGNDAILNGSGSTVMRERAVLDGLYKKRDAQQNFVAANDLSEKILASDGSSLKDLANESLPGELNEALRNGDKKKAYSLAYARRMDAHYENVRLNPRGYVETGAIQEQENRLADLQEKFDADAVKARDTAERGAGFDAERAKNQKFINSIRDDEGLAGELKKAQAEMDEKDINAREIAADPALLDKEKAARLAMIDAEKAAIATRMENLQREIQLRKAASADELQASQNARKMDEALRRGDTAGYAKARQEHDEAEARKKEQELREEAKGMFATEPERENFVKSRMDEFRQQQKNDRAKEDEEKKNRRVDARRGEESQTLQLRANILRKQGDTEGAKALEEQAAQIMDESKRRDLVKEFRDMGMDDGEAQKRADQQIKLDQANRELDRAENTKGTVVADSMASMGGSAGHGVYGVDPSLAKLDRSNELLKEIAANTGVQTDNRVREE